MSSKDPLVPDGCQNFSDEYLGRFVDSELPDWEHQRALGRILSDPECRCEVDSILKLRELIQAAYRNL